jgi:hypothetical protein
MQGGTARARAAYQDFLALWKDADPDIPILIAANAEYAKLKQPSGLEAYFAHTRMDCENSP